MTFFYENSSKVQANLVCETIRDLAISNWSQDYLVRDFLQCTALGKIECHTPRDFEGITLEWGS